MTFDERMDVILTTLDESGQSEAIAIGDMLKDMYEQEREAGFGRSDVEGILDQFIETAKWAKKEIRKR